VDYERAVVGKGKPFNESEMALFSECSLKCARKMLDTADIVRDASFRHSESGSAFFPKNGPNSRKYRGTNNTK
jgi:hypothetical protein